MATAVATKGGGTGRKGERIKAKVFRKFCDFCSMNRDNCTATKMPFATIHTRSLVPDFVMAPVLSFGAPLGTPFSCDSESSAGSISSKATTPGPDVVHPLYVSTILQKVFGYLSFWQQKKCRLVCRTWNAELLQLMRKRRKVNLTKLLESFVNSSSSSSSLPLSPASPLPMLQSLNLACTSFVIEDESQHIGYFLSHSNLTIKYIELRNISWNLSHVHKYILQQLPYLEELRIPIQCALPALSPSSSLSSSSSSQPEKSDSPTFARDEKYPNLKVIVVTYTLKDLHIYGSQDISVSSLLEILQRAPNLEEIYYPNIVQFTSPFENPARVLFKNIIYNGSMALNKLSSLKIDTFLRNEDLYTLAERQLPLKSLQLTLTPDIGCDELYDLLYSIEPTLRVLTFTFRDGYRLRKRFPHLDNLADMSVIIWNGYLDHLAEIARLKNLVVVLMEMNMEMVASGMSSSGGEGKEPSSFSEKTEIRQMEIHAVPKGSDLLVLKTIRLSPWNLKRLTIDHASAQYLRLIFRSLRLLEELLILYGDWTDTGLTGIPKEYCKTDILQKEVYAMGLKELPGITDLKNLRSLILTGVITDFSLVLGVTKCMKIKQLELIAKRYSKISDISLMKIADTMDLHYFRMTNFAPNVNASEGGLQYLKTKFNGRELYIQE